MQAKRKQSHTNGYYISGLVVCAGWSALEDSCACVQSPHDMAALNKKKNSSSSGVKGS